MKKFIVALTALLTLTVSAEAMSYSQARDRALFLTDKMAYELNLTEAQYEAAYEVNLDYLMSIDTYDDLYGTYWTNRNLDLSYILMDWQYRAFCAASYFYRPVYWDAGIWHFSIYARYPHRSYFYFGRPAFYNTYRGGHGWRLNGGRSWYRGRDFGHGHIANGHGMKDRFDHGDFRGHQAMNANRGGDRRFGGQNEARYNRGNGVDNRGYNRENGSFNRRNDADRQQRYTPGNRNGGTSNGQINNQSNTPRRSMGGKSDGRVNRESSTRTTARPQRMFGTGSDRQSGSVRNSQRSLPSRPSSTFSPRSNSSSSQSMRSASSHSSSKSSGMTRGGGSSSKGDGGGHFGGRR